MIPAWLTLLALQPLATGLAPAVRMVRRIRPT